VLTPTERHLDNVVLKSAFKRRLGGSWVVLVGDVPVKVEWR